MPTNPETDPELVVLEALRDTCALTRRYNPSPAVCAAVLKHEKHFCTLINRRKGALAKKAEGTGQLVDAA